MEELVSYNPADGSEVGRVPVTPVSEVPAVVARAKSAGRKWADRTPLERAQVLIPAGERLVERSKELGQLLTREMGKPLREGIGEVKGCGRSLEESVEEMAQALEPELLVDDHTRSSLYHDAFGVCAAITPWNFPLAMPHWMVLPALIAGNSVVLKPSEETPLIAQAYADVLNEVLPEHVLQMVHGGDSQGRALVAADVDLIAFTGSRDAGKHILEAAAGGLKRVILELGGKDPLIVLDDADLDKSANFAVQNSFRNAGQVCVSTERIYVADSIAPAFEAKMAELMAEMKVGPGDQDGVDIGPMINARQRDHVLAQVEAAVESGATLAAGGGSEDNFVRPTLLTGLTAEMPIMNDETFGPVACVVRFSDVEEAVRQANDSPYGLGAAVFGGDAERARSVARRLDAGMIGVNKGCGGASGSPWVGAKQSGYGYHGSKAGHRQFAQARVVSEPK